MVGFDSIIQPGRVGNITQKIDLKGMHGGPFAKSVTVTSNAQNTPTLRLTVRGTMRAIIDISPTYLQLSKSTEGTIVTLRTEHKDLKVSKVTFESSQRSSELWKDQIPTYVPYQLIRGEGVDSTGTITYKLVLTNKNLASNRQDGQFVIITNHPEKKEIKINGWIEPSAP